LRLFPNCECKSSESRCFHQTFFGVFSKKTYFLCLDTGFCQEKHTFRAAKPRHYTPEHQQKLACRASAPRSVCCR